MNPPTRILLAAVLALGAPGCSDGVKPESAPTSTPSPSATPTAYAPTIDPASFAGQQVDNAFMPLVPGVTMTYRSRTEDGVETTITEVTRKTRRILGVTCVVVHDKLTLDGEVVEDTFDWFAQDKDGNVWYFGEDTKEFEGGKVVSTKGSWEAGVDGAQPGIAMEAAPKVGDTYRQEFYAGEAEDMADVVSLTESAKVAYGSFQDLVMTKDYTPLEPAVVEHKFYARGIGLVLELGVKGGSERVELVTVEHG
jgi:hypothetical protein